MARILIRPDGLARLARRFDAAADDLAGAARRLARDRAEVRFNPADESFPSARVNERAALVENGLRRLAAEFRVDAGLMARTIDDADLDGEGPWTPGLASSAGVATEAISRSVGTLESVVRGLVTLDARVSSNDASPLGIAAVGPGGLFATSPRGGDGREHLVRLAERLEASTSFGDPAVGSQHEVDVEDVWSRIVGELFGADDGP